MPAPSDIVLFTVNARYIHPSLALRFLYANLGPLRSAARVIEFDNRQSVESIVEAILECRPRVVGLGVYIWNVTALREVVKGLRDERPDLVIVLGGPEVSHVPVRPRDWPGVDAVVQGEGEQAFAALCRDVLDGKGVPAFRVVAPAPDPAELALPYDQYTDEDLRTRLTYVETSRGCPFSCEYCLSALARGVRAWPLEPVLDALDDLLRRGATKLKFVDRTFNVDLDRAARVLRFFLDREREGLEVHFELVPGRLNDEVRDLLAAFGPSRIRLEMGVQTFNPAVARTIRRPLSVEAVEEDLRFLVHRTGCLVHADLIAGLPGESMESFAAGFNRLVSMGPREIQVGILKRLPGFLLARHDRAFGMVYRARPPYDLLSNDCIGPDDMDRLRRFAAIWERVVNRGRFPRTVPLLLAPGGDAFADFMTFSDWLFARRGRTHSLALDTLAEDLLAYLVAAGGGKRAMASALREDYVNGGRRRVPPFLQEG